MTIILNINLGEQKFHNIFAPGNEKNYATSTPRNNSSRDWKFHQWNFSSWERKYVGTKVP